MNTVFALYNMLGSFAMSGSILLSGLPSLLQEQYSALNEAESIQILYGLYSIVGLVVMIIYIMVSGEIEIKSSIKRTVKQTLSPKSKRIVGKLFWTVCG